MSAKLDLPALLQSADGAPIVNIEQWKSHRQVLLDRFSDHIYGRSLPTPIEQSYATSTRQGPHGLEKTVDISVAGPHGTKAFPLQIVVPRDATGPVPVMLDINIKPLETRDVNHLEDLPVADINAAGYAAAVFHVADVAADDQDTFRDQMINLFHDPETPLSPNAGKAISAWAWAASRVMDYLETDEQINAAQVCLVGHSRGGKAALWAGAQDQRFFMIASNSSGCTGAKLARRRRGDDGASEDVAKINEGFPHWFADSYSNYNNNEDALPVDQHQLLALVAPVPLAVGSATDDASADPEGEFLSVVAASDAFDLYRGTNSGPAFGPWPPALDQVLGLGHGLTYRLRDGEHGLWTEDWHHYLGVMSDSIARPFSTSSS